MLEENNVEFGSIQIHKKAIADIAYSAVTPMKDVAFSSSPLCDRMLEFFGKKSYSGIKVFIDKDNQVSIRVSVLISYGSDIAETARRVQEAIRNGIESMTDINLKNIHVDIQGVRRTLDETIPDVKPEGL